MNPWQPGPATRLAGVIGWPVRHTLSPAIHNAAFRALDLDWAYLAFEVAPGEVPGAVSGVRALGLQGLSVTLPHKEAAAAAVDRLSPLAEALGAVNTVVRSARGELRGENTDGPGFLRALADDEGFDPAGRRCLVLGAGGAARAVVKGLADAGAVEVVVVNRTRERAEAVAALAAPVARVGYAYEAGEADLIVNATSVGMAGGAAENTLLLDAQDLGPGQLVVDIVTNPFITPLIEAARSRGAVAVNGVGMLVHQAALAFRMWTGEDPPVAVMSAAALRELGAGLGRDGTGLRGLNAMTAIGCAVLGFVVGLVLNVLIDRVPERQKLLPLRFRCPRCPEDAPDHPGLPVAAWLRPGAPCPACGARLPARYLLVPVTNAALSAAVALRFGADWVLPAYLVFFAALLVLSVIDFQRQILPNRIVYPAIFASVPLLALAALANDDMSRLWRALGGGSAAWLALLLIHIISPGGMGFGDVRLSFLLGLFLGWLGYGYVLVGLFLGFLLGAVVGGFLVLLRIRSRTDQVPFGPFLAGGAAITVLFGAPIVRTWLG